LLKVISASLLAKEKSYKVFYKAPLAKRLFEKYIPKKKDYLIRTYL
jgi:hypothetical protein